ncbi:MAG: hypothetical protein AAFR59_18220, partial [Bacteroidota bacterium]
LQKNPSLFSFQLYFYDISATYDHLQAGMEKLPDGTGGCSDDAFYFQYLLAQRGREVSFCPSESVDYYITTEREGLPEGLSSYIKIHSIDDYQFYIRPPSQNP